jgi:hypothetical protein
MRRLAAGGGNKNEHDETRWGKKENARKKVNKNKEAGRGGTLRKG